MPRGDLTGQCPRGNSLCEDFVIQSRDGLYRSPRGDKTLLVDCDSASWAVVPPSIIGYLQDLEIPMAFSLFCATHPEKAPDSLKRDLELMYTHGFVMINGRNYYPPPEIMWQPLDGPPLYPRSFYFHMTDACNFRCTYCYARAEGKGKSMSVDMAKAIIDKLLAEIPHDYMYIEFHGGEPLLLKRDLAAIVDYGRRKAFSMSRRIDFSVQTNGSLIDDEVIEWALRNEIKIGISIDGAPEVHDRYRIDADGKGTFARVWKAITRAEDKGLRCGFIGVVHESDDYLRAYEFFVSRGILNFKLNYSASVGRASENYQFNELRAVKMAKGCLKMIDAAVAFNLKSPVKVKIHDINLYLGALTTKRRDYMCLRSPCGAGRSLLAFGTEGEIYPCEEMSTYPEFKCGSIKDTQKLTDLIDHAAAIESMRSRRVETIPECRSCTWRRFCAGKCLHKAYHSFGDIRREDPMCGFYRILFEELMWKIDEEPGVLTLR
jgi:uncharacterized protein